MVFCLIQGDAIKNSFPIDTSSHTTIGHLKKAIKDEKQNAFSGINTDKLTLWKVDIVQTKKNQEMTIKEHKGVELHSFESIGTHFQEVPLSTNIRIIIQPLLPATTDQCTRDTANLGYVPRREGNLGGTLLCPDQLTSNSNEGISLTDNDTSKRPLVVKSLIDDLLIKKIILVRAPPYSGKTSLTQLIEDYLINSAEYLTFRIIRFSTLWGNDVGKLCNYENFGEAWKEILGIDWLGESEPMDIDVDNKSVTAGQFWETVKCGLQGSHDIYIIMFGAYGYGSNLRDLSIPVEIPDFNSKSIYDIKFTDNELEEYVTNFCRYFNLKEHNENIIPEFIKYIKNATAGHVGFVRHILYYTREKMKPKVNELTWNKILVYLNSNGFNETINSNCRGLPKIKSFSHDEIKLCENVLLNKKHPYQSSNNHSVLALIKSGVLVIDKNYMLQFSAPIVMRSFIYQNYGNEKISETVPKSLYDFIVSIFTAMCLESRELLQRTLSFGFEEREETIILEQMWQKEFYRIGKRRLNGYFMSCDVGATFASNGYLDFYVDEPLNWAIKILREERCMAKHTKKFDETTEIYKEITLYAKSIAIVDICSESIKVQKLKENFVHVSYSKNYDAFKIECLGRDTMNINF
ncbi:hypothetical protein RhiirA5_418466 [Rhizophagus irregularis]|uniref:Crinkler effector protein N-terminal domain-containing protein n=2 Tax=Rhizophagus irregularis TaxID=588596 RepID=A0A2N0PK71_9GLOM|nr:hypothetical protein RhiirA5_418466 [Rhizophagus irregularis]